MSIKLADDTVKVFGTNLPTVYFDKIDFFDDHFEIELAIYNEGEVAQRQEYEEYIDYLRENNIKFYITLVMDGEVSPLTSVGGMPAPLVQATLNLSAEADYGSGVWEDMGEDIAEYALANIVEHSVRSAAVSMGLNPVHGQDGTLAGGESVTFAPAASKNMQYEALVPNYYTGAEVGGNSTNRIGRLVSGEISPLDLIRRDHEFSFGMSAAVDEYYCPEIFVLNTADASSLGIPFVYAKDLFRNPYLTFNPYSGGSVASGIFVNQVRAKYESIDGTDTAVISPSVGITAMDPGGTKSSPFSSLKLAARKNKFSPPNYGGAEYTTIYNDPNLDAPVGFAIDYPMNSNTIKFGIEDFEDSYEEIRREDGRLVYKRVLKINQAFRAPGAISKTPGGIKFKKWQESIKLVPQVTMIAYSSVLDIDLSSQKETATYNDQYTRGLISPFDDQVTDPVTCARMDKAIDKLNRALVSDVTYEPITTFGEVQKERFKIYVNSEGQEYEGDAIQDINGSYYGVPNLEYADVAQMFEELLVNSANNMSYHQRSHQNTPVLDLENRIKAALSSHGDKPSLLPKLNSIRKSVPDTTTATGTGRFYLKFRDTLANTNQIIENKGIPLKISYGVSQAVNDRRSYKFSPWNPPVDLNVDTSIGFINPWLSRVSKFGDRYITATHEGFGPVQQENLTNPYSEDTGNTVMNDSYVLGDKMDIYINGYYFFDYEKAINQASNISRILDVKKLERLYGRKITQEHYRLFSNSVKIGTVPGTYNFSYSLNSYMGEYVNNTDLEALGDVAIGVPSTQYQTGKQIPAINASPDGSMFQEHKGQVTAFYTHDVYPLSQPTSVFVGPQTHGPSSETELVGGYYAGMPRAYRDVPEDKGYLQDNGLYGQESREFTYTCLRNFEFPDPLLNPNNGLYRLMCFEFQFVVPEQNTQTMQDPCYNDYLQFHAAVLDDTEKVFESLHKHFMINFAILKEYAKEAAEFCSYSNLDDSFNDFFAESQEAKYENNLGKSPWFLVPIAYLIIKDLFANDFGGDMDNIKAAAADLARDISPRTGKLSNIAILVEAMADIETAYFTATGIEGAQNPADMYLQVLQDGVVSPRWRLFGGHGRDQNASNRFPLPKLNEALLTPQVPFELPILDEPIGLTITKKAPMVKMHFSAVNMPQTITATPFRDKGHKAAGSTHHGTWIGEDGPWHGNWQQNYIFLEIRNHPDNFVNFPDFPWDRDSDGNIDETRNGHYQTYKVAYYSQFAFTAQKKLTKSFDFYSAMDGANGALHKDKSETMGYGGYVDTVRTIMTTPKWNKGGAFKDYDGYNNRTGSTPIWRSIWLYAGMRYIIRWYIGGGSNIGGEMEYNTPPHFDTWQDGGGFFGEHPISDTLWSSTGIVIDVPVPENGGAMESEAWLPYFTPNLNDNWPSQQLSNNSFDWTNLSLAGDLLDIGIAGDIPYNHEGNSSNIPNKFTHYWIDGADLFVSDPVGKQAEMGETVYIPQLNGVNLMAKAVVPDPIESMNFKGFTYEIKNSPMPAGTKSREQFTGIPMFRNNPSDPEAFRSYTTYDYIASVKWGNVDSSVFMTPNGNMPSTNKLLGLFSQ